LEKLDKKDTGREANVEQLTYKRIKVQHKNEMGNRQKLGQCNE
jgi:hypothetical protein